MKTYLAAPALLVAAPALATSGGLDANGCHTELGAIGHRALKARAFIAPSLERVALAVHIMNLASDARAVAANAMATGANGGQHHSILPKGYKLRSRRKRWLLFHSSRFPLLQYHSGTKVCEGHGRVQPAARGQRPRYISLVTEWPKWAEGIRLKLSASPPNRTLTLGGRSFVFHPLRTTARSSMVPRGGPI